MLALGQQIVSDQADRAGIGGVEQDDQVAGPGKAVDADTAGQLTLGLLHVEVARTDDHVDRRNRLGAERQRGDGLGATHPEHPPTPTSSQAASITGSTGGGVAITTCSTPAERAVTAPITTVLG